MRIRERLRWPTMLEVFTILALWIGIVLGDFFYGLILAVLALAWSQHHREE